MKLNYFKGLKWTKNLKCYGVNLKTKMFQFETLKLPWICQPRNQSLRDIREVEDKFRTFAGSISSGCLTWKVRLRDIWIRTLSAFSRRERLKPKLKRKDFITHFNPSKLFIFLMIESWKFPRKGNFVNFEESTNLY